MECAHCMKIEVVLYTVQCGCLRSRLGYVSINEFILDILALFLSCTMFQTYKKFG